MEEDSLQGPPHLLHVWSQTVIITGLFNVCFNAFCKHGNPFLTQLFETHDKTSTQTSIPKLVFLEY